MAAVDNMPYDDKGQPGGNGAVYAPPDCACGAPHRAFFRTRK